MTAANNPDTQKAYSFEFIVRLLAPLAWAAIIIFLSLTPSPPKLPGLLGWDKLLHALAYGLLAILAAQLALYLTNDLNKACWQAGLASICYGALLEVLQLQLRTGRAAEWLDLLADVVGVFLACVLFRQVSGLITQTDEHPDANNG